MLPLDGVSWEALCAIAPEAVRSHFAGRIDADLEGRETLSAKTLRKREVGLADERLKLEEKEEGLVREMAEAGQAVQRRSDADPRAVLGLKEPPAL